MISYTTNRWGFGREMFSVKGSVLHMALVWAIPSSAFAGVVWWYQDKYIDPTTDQGTRKDAHIAVFYGFASILGFLLIFRTQKAYHRYWECAMFLQRARGEWFNATSNLTAFCSAKPEKHEDVEKFRQTLVRLMSLLFCSAVGEVADLKHGKFEIIDISMFDSESLQFLSQQKERSEIVIQWIQRLVVDNIRSNVVEIAPPIVSRVFQEFSLGIVNVAAAKKITHIPFPFPYSQLMQFLIVLQTIVAPVLAGYALHAWWVACAQVFVLVLVSWAIHFTAMEIEMPFGDDPNDLPMMEIVASMNESLIKLLHKHVQEMPAFDADAAKSAGFTLVPFKINPHIHGSCRSLDKGEIDAAQITVLIRDESDAATISVSVKDERPVAKPPPGLNEMSTIPPNIPATANLSRQPLIADAEMLKQLEQVALRIEEHLQRIGEDVKQVSIFAVKQVAQADRMHPEFGDHDRMNSWLTEKQTAELSTYIDVQCVSDV